MLARVGDRDISAEEFRSRYALTPYYGQFPDDPQVKTLVLASLIGEKILAEEAELLQLDTTRHVESLSNQLRKEAVIEAVVNEVFAAIKISDPEIAAAQKQAWRILEVEELVFATREEASAYREKLNSANGHADNGLSEKEISVYSVKWGDSDPEIEEILWELPPGKLSEPVPYRGHFYLFRVTGEKNNPLLTTATHEVTQRIRAMLERRKKDAAYKNFFDKMMRGTKTKVPADIMTFIAEQLELAFDIPASQPSDSTAFEPAMMTDGQFILARQRLSDRLDEVFITFDDGSHWTIGKFLTNLRYGPYPLNYSNKAAFRASFRNAAITMMEQEYVAREGERRGLDESEYVKTETRMWRESILADQMRLHVVRTVNGTDRSEKIKLLDQFLAAAVDKYDITVDQRLLQNVKLEHLKMVVFKRHFPGRQAAPSILPLDKLPNYFGKVYHKIN